MYDSSKTAFSWNGVAARGVADGEWITIDFPNDEASSYSGTRGEGGNVKSVDRRCTVTVTLQADSPTNAAWYAFYEASVEGPGLLRDRSSTAVLGVFDSLMPTKQPGQSRSRDKPTVEWVFTSPAGKLVPIAV